MTVRDFASAVDVFNDGTNVNQVPIDGQLVNMVVSGKMLKIYQPIS